MDIFDKIDKFKYRYIIVNNNQYSNLQSKYKDRFDKSKIPYNIKYCIIDWDEGIPLIHSETQMKTKTFKVHLGNKKGVGRSDLSFLDPYKTNDRSILFQSDKVSPNVFRIEQIYSIDHIWLAYTYITKQKVLRMCLNKNIFGEFKLIGSREMNLNEILLSL